jgi:hypothetical protein
MRLPLPADTAQRTGTRVREIAAEMAPRLLFVSAFASGLVTLMEADGSVIDEPVAWIGANPPQTGDAVLALMVPGRGHRHASGTRVAIGPVNRVSGAGGIVEREASATNSTTASTSSTSTYSDCITLSLPLGPGTWEITAMGDVAMIHSGATKADCQVVIDGVATSRQTPNLSTTVYGRFGASRRSTSVAGDRSITIAVQAKPFNAGTLTMAQPLLRATAIRTT